MEQRVKFDIDELPTMRHVPPLEWLLRKLDDLHERVDKLVWAAFDAGREVTSDQREEIERALRRVAKSLDCFAFIARRAPAARSASSDDIRQYLDYAFSNASAAVRPFDAVSFNRRSSEVEFHRAPGEPLLGAVLVVGVRVRTAEQLVERVNPDIREMLLSRLVVLEHPVNEETLRPIA